ncbi:MAG TPA: GntR family transcriptional regulator [Steroidobacteraceae bacterium]|nr:GntR family transcriptional regulator [Steroidobacteraceae bacterium]
MEIRIDFAADIPIYRQIIGQVRSLVALGLLQPGAGLPSIRKLALDLKVAANTVAKAYEELAAAGVVHRRRGFGTFVSCEPTQVVDAQHRHRIEQRIDALLAEARDLNFAPEALMELLQLQLRVRSTGAPMRAD